MEATDAIAKINAPTSSPQSSNRCVYIPGFGLDLRRRGWFDYDALMRLIHVHGHVSDETLVNQKAFDAEEDLVHVHLDQWSTREECLDKLRVLHSLVFFSLLNTKLVIPTHHSS